MTDETPPAPPPEPAEPAERGRTLRLTLRIGETVAVLGLALAAATFFIGRADRANETQAQAVKAAQTAQVQARAEALVLRGETDDEGAHIWLTPANAGQVIQSQRYIFPRAVRQAAREIGAGRPQIDRVWIEDGLRRERRALEDAGGEAPAGEDQVPVAIATTFIDKGETREDRAIYRLGYVIKRGALGRSSVELQGVSLLRRARPGDLQAQVDALWAQERPPPP